MQSDIILTYSRLNMKEPLIALGSLRGGGGGGGVFAVPHPGAKHLFFYIIYDKHPNAVSSSSCLGEESFNAKPQLQKSNETF